VEVEVEEEDNAGDNIHKKTDLLKKAKSNNYSSITYLPPK
jgi:hypothetical protein